ncbi:hypothetical protein ACMHYB_56895 [Sorangium sp. So ce1128]
MRIARAAFPLAIPFLVACSVSAGGEPASLDEGQSALEGGECPLLGEEAIEHTCIHAGVGPFVTVTAGADPATTTTDVSAEHTAYTVNLVSSGAGFGGAVLYTPDGDGDFAIFLDPSVNVSVLDSSGTPVAIEEDVSIDPAECASLSRALVVELSSAETYTIVFEPSSEQSALVLIENLAEFNAPEGILLTAARFYDPSSLVVAEEGVEHPFTFELPSEIPVVSGNAGKGWVVFAHRDGESDPFTYCFYQGGASVWHPTTPADVAAGEKYEFVACTDDAVPGDDVVADHFKLSVLKGDQQAGTTTVELLILDEGCGGHEHEH